MSPSTSPDKVFKLVLLGEGNVGKTSWVRNLLRNPFEETYNATIGVVVKYVDLNTSHGFYRFAIWECPAQESLTGCGGERLNEADAAVLMFGVDDKTTLNGIPKWVDDLNRRRARASGTPYVLCGNKADRTWDRKLTAQNVRLPSPDGVYLEMSVKASVGVIEPLLHLLKVLLSLDETEKVTLVEEYPLLAPEAGLDDPNTQHTLTETIAAVAAMTVPHSAETTCVEELDVVSDEEIDENAVDARWDSD